MRISEFRYDLPEDLIAQQPAPVRDAARLMDLDRASGRRRDLGFRDLPSLLGPGDLLVLNDTKVIPARLAATKSSGARVEVLLLEPETPEAREESGGHGQTWLALVRGFGRRRPGAAFTFPGPLTAEIAGPAAGEGIDEEVVRVMLRSPGPIAEALGRAGSAPLPPYIKRKPGDSRGEEDRQRYQTVYAREAGAVAAPTAGLHFTRELLAEIRARGVEVRFLTLHVGWGTFQPVRSEEIEEHVVAPERCVIGEDLAAAHARVRAAGGRVVAVGTTVTRALEGAVGEGGALRAGASRCGIVILPGHAFRAVDALVTNFHLPESSLLLLVAAFAGRETILSAYRDAVSKRYRFYSYGDAMFIR